MDPGMSAVWASLALSMAPCGAVQQNYCDESSALQFLSPNPVHVSYKGLLLLSWALWFLSFGQLIFHGVSWGHRQCQQSSPNLLLCDHCLIGRVISWERLCLLTDTKWGDELDTEVAGLNWKSWLIPSLILLSFFIGSVTSSYSLLAKFYLMKMTHCRW